MAILLMPLTACALGPSVNKARITWDRNTEADLKGYCLYWKVKGASAYSDSARLCLDKDVALPIDLNSLSLSPNVYNLIVTATDLEGNESGPSNEVEWDAVLPAAPKNTEIRGNE